jgi:SagB-type dehydrogenase family enzyme
MRRLLLMAGVVALSVTAAASDTDMIQQERARIITLPEPRQDGEMSVEAALLQRHSVREYSGDPVTLAELSQLLWAAQGITHSRDMRTAPSAGALYPLELYVVAGRVDGLERGLYRYRIGDHDLLEVSREDLQDELAAAALAQDCVADAAALIVVAGVVERTAVKYGERALRYVHMEVGAVAQNVYLQATALGLGTVYVGAFRDARVKQALGMPDPEDPFAILPVGRPQ